MLPAAPRRVPLPLALTRQFPFTRHKKARRWQLRSPLLTLLLATPHFHPRPILLQMPTRVLRPPSRPHAHGRVAASTTTGPRMNASASAMQLSFSPCGTTRRPARDERGGWRMARTAVCIRGKGRAPGASEGAGSDVVDVGSALHPTASPVPLFVPHRRGRLGVGRRSELRLRLWLLRCLLTHLTAATHRAAWRPARGPQGRLSTRQDTRGERRGRQRRG